MGSLQLQTILEDSSATARDAGTASLQQQRMEWMLNCQEPPSLLEEHLRSIRRTIFMNNRSYKKRKFTPDGYVPNPFMGEELQGLGIQERPDGWLNACQPLHPSGYNGLVYWYCRVLDMLIWQNWIHGLVYTPVWFLLFHSNGTRQQLPGGHVFLDIHQYPMAMEAPGIMVIRVDSALICFANANFIRDRILGLVNEEAGEENINGSRKNIQAVILDLSNVTNADTSGIHALEELHIKLMSSNIEVAFVNPRWRVMHMLKLLNSIEKIGKDRFFLSIGEAVDACSSMNPAEVANAMDNEYTIIYCSWPREKTEFTTCLEFLRFVAKFKYH
ncbi:hypothetical protein SAY86_026985 [Trapa natans]|uniref:STAS domain-containing protein n=1 Tax=Trapa natans TaxID=22666 RepID=A0AAN7KSA6_TRANT|nr:hypothetical protein SAY86_026985 [Trapa natans]